VPWLWAAPEVLPVEALEPLVEPPPWTVWVLEGAAERDAPELDVLGVAGRDLCAFLCLARWDPRRLAGCFGGRRAADSALTRPASRIMANLVSEMWTLPPELAAPDLLPPDALAPFTEPPLPSLTICSSPDDGVAGFGEEGEIDGAGATAGVLEARGRPAEEPGPLESEGAGREVELDPDELPVTWPAVSVEGEAAPASAAPMLVPPDRGAERPVAAEPPPSEVETPTVALSFLRVLRVVPVFDRPLRAEPPRSLLTTCRAAPRWDRPAMAR
jgi:hypothetical protein